MSLFVSKFRFHMYVISHGISLSLCDLPLLLTVYKVPTGEKWGPCGSGLHALSKGPKAEDQGQSSLRKTWGTHPAFLESPETTGLWPQSRLSMHPWAPFITHLQPPQRSGPVGTRSQIFPPKPLPVGLEVMGVGRLGSRKIALGCGAQALCFKGPHTGLTMLKWHQSS